MRKVEFDGEEAIVTFDSGEKAIYGTLPAFYPGQQRFLTIGGNIVGVSEFDSVLLIGDRVRIVHYEGSVQIIPNPKQGTIVEIVDYDTDHYYNVLLDDGEMLYTRKSSCIELL